MAARVVLGNEVITIKATDPPTVTFNPLTDNSELRSTNVSTFTRNAAVGTQIAKADVAARLARVLQ